MCSLELIFHPTVRVIFFIKHKGEKKSFLHASTQTSLVVFYLRVKIKVSIKSLTCHITPLLPTHSAVDALVSHLFLTCAKYIRTSRFSHLLFPLPAALFWILYAHSFTLGLVMSCQCHLVNMASLGHPVLYKSSPPSSIFYVPYFYSSYHGCTNHQFILLLSFPPENKLHNNCHLAHFVHSSFTTTSNNFRHRVSTQ